MRIQFAGNGNGNEYVRDAGAEVEAEVEAVAEAVAVVEDEAAFSERTFHVFNVRTAAFTQLQLCRCRRYTPPRPLPFHLHMLG